MFEHESIDCRTAIVTGAGRGIGRAVAQTLAERGARIVINDMDLELAEKAASELESGGAEAIAVQADVTAPEMPCDAW